MAAVCEADDLVLGERARLHIPVRQRHVRLHRVRGTVRGILARTLWEERVACDVVRLDVAARHDGVARAGPYENVQIRLREDALGDEVRELTVAEHAVRRVERLQCRRLRIHALAVRADGVWHDRTETVGYRRSVRKQVVERVMERDDVGAHALPPVPQRCHLAAGSIRP